MKIENLKKLHSRRWSAKWYFLLPQRLYIAVEKINDDISNR